MSRITNRLRLPTLALVAATFFLAPRNADAQTNAPVDYADGASWLCKPGRQDACAIDMTTTVVRGDGSVSAEPWSAAASPPVDCFYVYPTVSTDTGTNSDMTPDAPELRVIEQQFARFASVCRPFAPSYRQVTLAGLRAVMTPNGFVLDQGVAYEDVLDAFRYYVRNESQGRDFVLIGHSQGAFILTRLIAEEIDGKPLQGRMLSGILLGATVSVAEGGDVGGSFQSVRLCRSPSQTGCVITYASFRSTAPPPASSLFGVVKEPGLTGACTNPAALAGGTAQLHAYLSANGTTISGVRPVGPWAEGLEVTTPFVSTPGLLSARCATNENAAYLEITVNGEPNDPRVDDIVGDITPQWGLHLVDVNVAMGDLLEIVRAQAAARAR